MADGLPLDHTIFFERDNVRLALTIEYPKDGATSFIVRPDINKDLVEKPSPMADPKGGKTRGQSASKDRRRLSLRIMSEAAPELLHLACKGDAITQCTISSAMKTPILTFECNDSDKSRATAFQAIVKLFERIRDKEQVPGKHAAQARKSRGVSYDDMIALLNGVEKDQEIDLGLPTKDQIAADVLSMLEELGRGPNEGRGF